MRLDCVTVELELPVLALSLPVSSCTFSLPWLPVLLVLLGFAPSVLDIKMAVVPDLVLKTVLLSFELDGLWYGTRTSSLRWFHVE